VENKTLKLAAVLVLLVTLISCDGIEPASSQTQGLFRSELKHSSRSIKVCWVTGGNETWKDLTKDAVQREWNKKTAVEFFGWENCKSGEDGDVRVLMQPDEWFVACLGTSNCGLKRKYKANVVLTPNAYSTPFTCWYKAIVLNHNMPRIFSSESCFQKSVLHEFGHALGLLHEQQRYDASCLRSADKIEAGYAEPIGPYDTESVMNYCFIDNRISNEDVAVINALYLRDDYDFWGQLKIANKKCLAYDRASDLLSLEDCKDDDSQIWGLSNTDHKLVHVGSYTKTQGADLCLDAITGVSSKPLSMISCQMRPSLWEYDESTQQLRLIISAGIERSERTGSSLVLSEYSGNAHLELISAATKAKPLTWPGMLKSDYNKFKLYASYGGEGGKPFDDRANLKVDDPIKVIWIRSGDRLDQIGAEYSSGRKVNFGPPFANYQKLVLKPGEYISSVRYSLGAHKHSKDFRVFGIEITTNYGNSLKGGTMDDIRVVIKKIAPHGEAIWGFHGRSGREVDNLGFYTLKVE
jgi:hypothetical protein